MSGLHGDMYIGTKGGAIFSVDITKMVVHGVLHLQENPVNCLLLIKQLNHPKMSTRKLKTTTVNSDHEDDILLVNFALGYHGISQYSSESRPPTYNYPQMTSPGHYQQPVVTPDSDDLYMLLWSTDLCTT